MRKIYSRPKTRLRACVRPMKENAINLPFFREIRKALESSPQASFAEIAGVRQKQVDYLKATNKFPDFIDVGLDVWFAVHDWHIKHLQQMVLGRDSSGRYTITLLSTQLVMRPDLVSTFISAPYDNR